MEYRYEGFLNYCIYVVYTEMKSAELNLASGAELKIYQKLISYMTKMQGKISKILVDNGFLADGSFSSMQEKAGKLRIRA